MRTRLANQLDFPEQFFTREDVPELTPEQTSFRALTAMTARERDQALAAGCLAFEFSSWLDARFNGPAPDVPQLQGNSEAAANTIRSNWNLGDRPISNITHVMDAHGVRVFSLVEGTRRLDAFATWYDHAPYAFLNTTKSAERGRFDLAHELAHLAMHREVETVRNRGYELEADRFAGAFLMPASGIFARAPRRPTLDFVMDEKHHWGVPAMSLVVRLHELSLLSEWHYRTFCIELSKQGYRLEEPDGRPNESSLLLAKVFELLREQQVSRIELAAELGFNPSEIDQLTFGLSMSGLPGGGETSRRNRRHLGLVAPLDAPGF